jgi:DNA-binding MurR/RpiR family transcriptional regulator
VTISNLIAAASERLTPTDRRIAEVVLAEPTLLVFGTVSDLAGRVGTSRPSIVRFATKLGFGGFTELQEQVREGLSRQLSRPSERIRQQDGALATTRASLQGAIGTALDALEGERLVELARPIVRAENVWILTGETSGAGGYALHSGLSIIRPRVHLVLEHSSAGDLSCASTGDAAVVFDFARYRRHSISAARALASLGVDIVAITDGPLSPLASLTETWCEIKVPAVGPFDSSVPAVAVAELLVAHVAAQLRDGAQERIDRTEAMWEATETFLP